MRSTIPPKPKKPYISAFSQLRSFLAMMSSPSCSSNNFAKLLKGGTSTKIPTADKMTFTSGSS